MTSSATVLIPALLFHFISQVSLSSEMLFIYSAIFFAGIAGILFAFELGSVQPAQTGEFYELFAIAAAVLGGCSLRGGEGSILGVIIAAAVIRIIFNSINMVGISTHLEFGILGLVILLGVIGDEMLKKKMAERQVAASEKLAAELSKKAKNSENLE